MQVNEASLVLHKSYILAVAGQGTEQKGVHMLYLDNCLLISHDSVMYLANLHTALLGLSEHIGALLNNRSMLSMLSLAGWHATGLSSTVHAMEYQNIAG